MTRGWTISLLLLGVAALLGALSATASTPSSPLPSANNPGPQGLKALRAYLEESGRTVEVLEAAEAPLRAPLRTLVLAEPTGRALSPSEVDGVLAFLERGGRVVYLAPESPEAQPELERALGVDREGARSVPAGALLQAAGSMQAQVVPFPRLASVRALRVASQQGVASLAPGALPFAHVAGVPVALFRKVGKGELWLFADASVAQNVRLERDDNLALWELLVGAGPLAFDERHLSAPPRHLPGALPRLAAQLLLVGAAFALARGIRLAPPRSPPVHAHRSSLDYVESLAALAQSSRLELPLLQSALARLRVLLQERLGISTELPDAEAALALEVSGSGVAKERFEAVTRALETARGTGVTAAEYHRLSRELAQLEQQLRG